MIQALQELRKSKIRTLLIVITLSFITLMVTFLSSLTQGLSHQSVSALQEVVQEDAIIISDTSTTLSSSHLTNKQAQELENIGAYPLYFSHEKNGDTVNVIMNWKNNDYPSQKHYFDHQEVKWITIQEAQEEKLPISAMIIPQDKINKAQNIDNIKILEGKDRWNLSGAYAGEQLSLNLMIIMLYIVSIIITSAFFIIWTLQRIPNIAVSLALGASRRVLVLQSLTQSLIITIISTITGSLSTIILITMISESLPAVINSSTILLPSILIILSTIIGSLTSLVPIFKVDPKKALSV